MDKALISEDDFNEWLARWWAMRQMAIEVGLVAEKMLAENGALSESQRRFYNREEWRALTERRAL